MLKRCADSLERDVVVRKPLRIFRHHALAMIAVMTGLSLSGCITYQPMVVAAQPSQAILDGTIRNPADWAEAPTRVAAAPVPRRPRKDELPVVVGSIHNDAPEDIVFSDAWWAKENRENDRLKRVMNICRGC